MRNRTPLDDLEDVVADDPQVGKTFGERHSPCRSGPSERAAGYEFAVSLIEEALIDLPEEPRRPMSPAARRLEGC